MVHDECCSPGTRCGIGRIQCRKSGRYWAWTWDGREDTGSRNAILVCSPKYTKNLSITSTLVLRWIGSSLMKTILVMKFWTGMERNGGGALTN